MKEYLSMVKDKMSGEFSAKFMQVLREENEKAGRLAKAASTEYMDVTNQVLSFVQYFLAIGKIEVQVISLGTDWTVPFVSYLRNETFPEDHNASRRLKVQLSRFLMIGDVLYKRGFSHPYLRCLTPSEVDYVMREIHERVCGNHLGARRNHSGARSLVHKLIQAGYYWPTM